MNLMTLLWVLLLAKIIGPAPMRRGVPKPSALGSPVRSHPNLTRKFIVKKVWGWWMVTAPAHRFPPVRGFGSHAEAIASIGTRGADPTEPNLGALGDTAGARILRRWWQLR